MTLEEDNARRCCCCCSLLLHEIRKLPPCLQRSHTSQSISAQAWRKIWRPRGPQGIGRRVPVEDKRVCTKAASVSVMGNAGTDCDCG